MIRLSECMQIRYKEAGYTHYVLYKEWKDAYGDYITAGFPTTQDALKTHLEAIKSRDTVQLEVLSL